MNRSEVIAATHDALNRCLGTAASASLLQHLQVSLGISRAQIEAGCLHYTLESFESDNDIYADVATHVAMWIEYQNPRGIHARRQSLVLHELQQALPRSIADIGFGAPTRYVRDFVLATPGVVVDLLDKYPAAIEVGRSLLEYFGAGSQGAVRFGLHDMDADPPLGGRDCYLLLDSIEHAAEPTRYLRATISVARARALFLFHLPIGPLIPSHSMAWENDREARLWLESLGLRVDRTEFNSPNPQVDLFAGNGVDLKDLFVVARKR